MASPLPLISFRRGMNHNVSSKLQWLIRYGLPPCCLHDQRYVMLMCHFRNCLISVTSSLGCNGLRKTSRVFCDLCPQKLPAYSLSHILRKSRKASDHRTIPQFRHTVRRLPRSRLPPEECSETHWSALPFRKHSHTADPILQHGHSSSKDSTVGLLILV